MKDKNLELELVASYEDLIQDQKTFLNHIQSTKNGLQAILDCYYANMQSKSPAAKRTNTINPTRMDDLVEAITTVDVLLTINQEYLAELRGELIKVLTS